MRAFHYRAADDNAIIRADAGHACRPKPYFHIGLFIFGHYAIAKMIYLR